MFVMVCQLVPGIVLCEQSCWPARRRAGKFPPCPPLQRPSGSACGCLCVCIKRCSVKHLHLLLCPVAAVPSPGREGSGAPEVPLKVPPPAGQPTTLLPAPSSPLLPLCFPLSTSYHVVDCHFVAQVAVVVEQQGRLCHLRQGRGGPAVRREGWGLPRVCFRTSTGSISPIIGAFLGSVAEQQQQQQMVFCWCAAETAGPPWGLLGMPSVMWHLQQGPRLPWASPCVCSSPPASHADLLTPSVCCACDAADAALSATS